MTSSEPLVVSAHGSFEQWRKPVSRVLALGVIVGALFTTSAFNGTTVGEWMEMSGFVLLMLAALGRIWCALYIAGRKNAVLCTSGPYALSRNPLYFFSLVGVVGFGVALQSAIATAVLCGAFGAYYWFVIRDEEQRLAQLFGADYASYVATVPRFFPKLAKPERIESYVVAPKVLERALTEVFWFLFAIVILELLELLHGAGYWATWTLRF